VPFGKRYDHDPNVRGGNTKLVVSRNRRVTESFAVLGRTHTNCAGGLMPWDSWITCEEIFNYGSLEANVTPGTGVPHGYCFEVDAHADGPVEPIRSRPRPLRARGLHLARRCPLRDRGPGQRGLLPLPAAAPAARGGRPRVVRGKARGAGGEGPAELRRQPSGAGRDVPGGGGELKLIYESPGPTELDGPDNVVVVPPTGDVWLREDAGGEQYIRGVTRRGEIYDFARTVLNNTEFCGGTLSPDGKTFFVNQQGDRVTPPSDTPPSLQAYTFAIWGPFGGSRDHDDDD
jgi:hypothetical protein